MQDALTHLPDGQCADLGDWRSRRVLNPSFPRRFEEECGERRILGILEKEGNTDILPSPLEPICSNKYDHFYLTTKQGLPPGAGEEFRYNNWFSSVARTIVAENNLGRVDPGTGVPPSNWPKAPHRWSEVAFAIWINVCGRQKVSPSMLKYIAQMGISNQLTEEVITDIHKNDKQKDGPDPNLYHREFRSNDPNFYALLGSPHGVGPASLLTQYANTFAARKDPDDPMKVTSVKNIDSVTLAMVPLGIDLLWLDCDLAFTLEDVDPPPPR